MWLQMARDSSGRGIKYGQLALGLLHRRGDGGLVQDLAQAVAFLRLAAEQGLDFAQCQLGILFLTEEGVYQDFTEGVRLFQLAAARGHPLAFYCMGMCREYGDGVRKSKVAAIRWYRRAQAAGFADAADALRRLSACAE